MGVLVSYSLGQSLIKTIQEWLREPQKVSLPEIADAKNITDKLIRYASTGKAVMS
ncbi:MAG: hypothetical protein R6V27_16310 [Balneolaceae bacterium]